jgi:hypothetical protein
MNKNEWHKKAYVTLVKMSIEYIPTLMTTSITTVFDLFENTEKVYIKLAYGPGSKDT